MMPTRFRWLWYLVGLAGMALMVFGLINLLGSAAGAGLLIPLVVGGAIMIGFVLRRFKRSLDAAVANAPSRQGAAGPPAAPSGGAAAGPPPPTNTTDRSANDPDRTGADRASSPGTGRPSGDPPRTSRR